jgi:hypothetical protein
MYTASAKVSRSAHPIGFSSTEYSLDTVAFGGMGHVHMKKKRRKGCGRIIGGLRVLKLAADIWKAMPLKGAHYSYTNMLTSS